MPSKSEDGNVRVAVVVSHPIQHFCPFYRAVHQDGRVAIRVLFAASAGLASYFDPGFNRTVSWGERLLDGFESEFLPGADAVADLRASLRNRHVSAALDRSAPDAVVVYGLYHQVSRAAIAWCRARGRAVLYVADSSIRTHDGLLRRLRKTIVLPFYFRQIGAFLTAGDSNEAYLRRYGADRHASSAAR